MTNDWIDRKLYPFKSKFIELDGHNIHCVDEGSGETILFVHGTPEWSFAYRELVKALSKYFRCIAIDHLGFGLSDKPGDANYTTKKHAERLEMFINKTGLQNINIVANDFGGSIALSYAINYPENVNCICLANTWMWSLANDKHYMKPAKFIQSWFGKFLYRQLNFPVNILMPEAYGDRSKLTKKIHRHYKQPLSKPEFRIGTYAFARDLLNASSWWDSLWEKTGKISNKPILIFWGMKDRFIMPKELDKWIGDFPQARIIRLENAGHFVHEEEPEVMIREIRSFIRS